MKANEGMKLGEAAQKGFLEGIKRNEKLKLTITEAIEAIMNNYPPESYSILREALNMAIDIMLKEAEKEAGVK